MIIYNDKELEKRLRTFLCTPYVKYLDSFTYVGGILTLNFTNSKNDKDSITVAISDLSESAHVVEFITSNYTLEDSTTFTGIITIKNVTAGNLNINTITADKLETLDTQVIGPGDSFTIKKYTTNDYRVI